MSISKGDAVIQELENFQLAIKNIMDSKDHPELKKVMMMITYKVFLTTVQIILAQPIK